LLELDNINTYYWERRVLWDLSLKVPDGGVVAILGRNGMGKSTLIRSIMGLTPPATGEIRFKNEVISGLAPHRIAHKGLAFVPQGRGIFQSLSVKENLTVVERTSKGEGAWDLEAVYDLFPILRERAGLHANLLSGGEQQMLAVGRALMMNPELLIMDEPSEGLAPMVIKQIGEVICRLKGKLTVFLAEQNLNMALTVADHIYIIDKGAVVYDGKPEDLRNDHEAQQKWLGV
jgi:branched-chain amino acid transport system ATP-binding protein